MELGRILTNLEQLKLQTNVIEYFNALNRVSKNKRKYYKGR